MWWDLICTYWNIYLSYINFILFIVIFCKVYLVTIENWWNDFLTLALSKINVHVWKVSEKLCKHLHGFVHFLFNHINILAIVENWVHVAVRSYVHVAACSCVFVATPSCTFVPIRSWVQVIALSTASTASSFIYYYYSNKE